MDAPEKQTPKYDRRASSDLGEVPILGWLHDRRISQIGTKGTEGTPIKRRFSVPGTWVQHGQPGSRTARRKPAWVQDSPFFAQGVASHSVRRQGIIQSRHTKNQRLRSSVAFMSMPKGVFLLGKKAAQSTTDRRVGRAAKVQAYAGAAPLGPGGIDTGWYGARIDRPRPQQGSAIMPLAGPPAATGTRPGRVQRKWRHCSCTSTSR